MILNCNSSLRVPPLLAYDLSNFDVILPLCSSLASPLLSNLTTASLFYTTFEVLQNIVKLPGSHDFMTHCPNTVKH